MPESTSKRFSGVFISYRRDDSSGHAGRLFDRLSAHFGDAQIFMDIDHIEPGEDFVQVIENAVGSCEILLAIIGRNWLSSADATSLRLSNPNDFVRLEIVSALNRDIRVIPVLVQGATMPRPQDLPDDMSKLSRRNALELSDLRWQRDVDQLIRALERILALREEERDRAAQEEQHRQQLEAEARKKVEEEGRQRELREREAAEAARTANAERQKRELEQRRRHERQSREIVDDLPGLLDKTSPIVAEETTRVAANIPDRISASSPPPRARTSRSVRLVGSQPVTEVPPQGSVSGHLEGVTVDNASGSRALAKARRVRGIALIVAGTVAVVVVGVIIIWLIRGTTTQNASSAKSEPTSGQQSNSVDGKPKAPEGMVYVAGGPFMMGRDKSDDPYESPAHAVTVEPFFIDIYEVTREDYQKCVDDKKCPLPQGWVNTSYPVGTARIPVTGVTWDYANDYARWAGKRLPKEEEWEFAARGKDGRRYPWGPNWDPSLANADKPAQGLVAVGVYEGKSPDGAFDMAGNAWEWTATKMSPYPGGTLPATIKVSDDMKVIRGGTYQSNRNQVTTTFRRGYPTPGDDDYSIMGFRCVRDIK